MTLQEVKVDDGRDGNSGVNQGLTPGNARIPVVLTPEIIADGRDDAGKFAAGNKIGANGRPQGARQKLATKFASDLYEVWQAHGPEILQRAALKDPVAFSKMVASLMPKDVKLSAGEDFKQLMQLVASGGAKQIEHQGTTFLELEAKDHQRAMDALLD